MVARPECGVRAGRHHEHQGRRRARWAAAVKTVPGVLLLLFATGHYGDVFLAWLTGWGLEITYAIGQSIMPAGLWLVIAVLLRSHRMRWPIWAVCASGAWESLLRIGCIGWVELAGMVVTPNQNLCEAATGIELYQWGLVQLAALALLIAGSAHNRGQHG